MKNLIAFSPLGRDISQGKFILWTIRTHTPRQFLPERVIYHSSIVPATAPIFKGLHAHIILTTSSFFLYLLQL